ncbi:MAG: hypothetical protein RR739_09220, partial [Clostridia bacterium]
QMETGMKTSMDNIVKEVESAVADMNLSTDAAKAANDTVAGFTSAINNKHDAVSSAGTSLGNAFASAFRAAMQINSPSKLFAKYGEGTVEGFIGGVESMYPAGKAAMVDEANMLLTAFASGQTQTMEQNASTGAVNYAMVSDHTSGAAIHIVVSPTYSFAGVTGNDGIQKALTEHDAELRALVLDVIAEAGIDAERRTYK